MKRLVLVLVFLATLAQAQTIGRYPFYTKQAAVAGGAATVQYDSVNADVRDGYSDNYGGTLNEELNMQTGPPQMSSVSKYTYGGWNTGREMFGVEFPITLAKSTTIDSAFIYIMLNSIGGTYGTNDTTKILAYSDTGTVFAAAHTHELDGHQTLVADSVRWNVPVTTETFLKSPDVKVLLQAIVNGTNWASGKSAGFVLAACMVSTSWDAYSSGSYYSPYDFTVGKKAYIAVWTH